MVSAFGVFQMRQYLITFPAEYLDAARVDGMGELGIFWKIVFPNCTPAIATLGILSFRLIMFSRYAKVSYSRIAGRRR
jgi:multiple sugar transport system permease protein